MEVELKYLIKDESLIDKLWNVSVFEKYGEVELRPSIEMHAIYYDTEDQKLSNMKAAFRIRKEGKKNVATLKWGTVKDEENKELSQTEELNIQLAEDYDCSPSLNIFSECTEGRHLIKLIKDDPLHPMFESVYSRRTMRIDTGTTICEVVLDLGHILTSKGTLRICELEIELFSGEILEIKEIGKDIANRFGLEAGWVSKYGRGIRLLRGDSK